MALVSQAVRAEKTYHHLRKEILRLPKPDVIPSIYESDAEDLLFLCQGIPNTVRSILIVGHNPGLENFASGLLFGNPEASCFTKFPTASLLGVNSECENWKDISFGKSKLKVFWIPGQIGKL